MAQRFLTSTIAVLLWLLWLPPAQADSVTVQNLRMWRAPDHTRLVFDLSGPLEHRLFTLADPHRLVIDMERAKLAGALAETEADNPLIGAVRTGKPEGDVLRIVIDLKAEVKPRSFVLKPAGQYGHRLVVDLYDARQTPEDDAAKPATEPARPVSKPEAPAGPRMMVIAIDAGHGGEDPGALGRRYRTREKDVTLAVARELARLIDQTPNMKALLIRDGDYYVGLRSRFQKARKNRADVFISIHADAVPAKQARGSSVYALSERGASNAMARHLADRENAADLIGGVSLNDKDSVLARVLLDMSHSKTIEHSLLLGEDILGEIKRVGHVHQRRVQQAGFAVLKSPDIPSVLVETAFISNPDEERKLRTPAFQRSLAQGILAGVKRFVARQAPSAPPPRPATVEARVRPQEHVVQQGETLASIARQYNLHIEALRFLNSLSETEPPVGMRLRLPPEKGG
ncbi:MAG: AMIN domain-containing protein [Gammaproteobacteria bacterium]|nr:MAG: AMIN domain-containing protein [Gammaproteobacteria bacterium]